MAAGCSAPWKAETFANYLPEAASTIVGGVAGPEFTLVPMG